jgi:hypothetical protein
MDKKIGVIGNVGHGKNAVIQELINKKIDMVIVNEPDSQDESFYLNDVKYAPIEKEQRKHKHVSSKLGGIMAMGSMVYMPYMNDLYGESKYERKLPDGIDIVKEYGLIEKKKSKLSKWERDMVVIIFQKNYHRVE